jgi:heme A synthase
MTVLCHDDLEQNSSEQASARSQWRARVLFVGGGFQGVVGAWWLVRGLAPLTTWLVAGIFGAVVVLAGVTVTSSLLSSAPRPQVQRLAASNEGSP